MREYNRKSVSILIVEDVAMTAVFIRTILEKHKYRVLKAVSTGEKAVQAYVEMKPDLILMDIRLAGVMNGVEAMNEIRKGSDVAVIFMSGYSDEEVKKEAASVNPLAYLSKPLNTEKLLDIIKSFADQT